MAQLSDLRRRHSCLYYRGYTHQVQGQDLVLEFNLLLEPELQFRPQLRWRNLPEAVLDQVRTTHLSPTLDRLFFQLGLAELPSYYKAACPPTIIIEHQGQIDKTALPFWHKLLIKGLGEFFYRNQIDFTATDFLTLELLEKTSPTLTNSAAEDPVRTSSEPTSPPPQAAPILVPVGGGKDSATLLCLLEEKNLSYDVLLLQPQAAAARQIADHMQARGHCQRIVVVDRQLDSQLLVLNQQGYLNGHTPFSAYLAMVSVTSAYLYGQTQVWLANEKSSEEENLTWLDHSINHQYSKSLEFEQDFRRYAKEQLFVGLAAAPNYRSALRQWNELEITQQLVELTQRLSVHADLLTMIRSCNVGQKTGQWCHRCPKCAFVFTLLAACLDEEVVSQRIFHDNLLIRPDLLSTLEDLSGLGDKKPFECVGTFAEMQTAILMAESRSRRRHSQLHSLARRIQTQQLLQELTGQTILILGLGQEGLSTVNFLRRLLPQQPLAVADQDDRQTELIANANYDSTLIRTHFGPDYLQHLDNYQIIIKTPGIPLTTPEIQAAIKSGAKVYSPTQLFFAMCQGHIIGITGTKGKSTTSTLIYKLLQTKQADTVLVGNIGLPALDYLDRITPQTWVVAELSCHQLAELEVSPPVSVVLDIKSEHLDYYPDFASYFQAKTAIARFQKNNDYLIYNPELAGSKKMAALSPAQQLTHSLTAASPASQEPTAYFQNGQIYLHHQPLLMTKELQLLGNHNLYNILPAIIVADLHGVTRETIAQVVKQFQGLPHRLERVATQAGVSYINDSIAVNPHATIMAVQSFPVGQVILLAGGYERQQDFSELIEVLVKQKIKHLITMPDTGARLQALAEQAQLPCTAVADLKEAVVLATQIAEAGDVVLLSPASASYNSFHNYQERGQRFAELTANTTNHNNQS